MNQNDPQVNEKGEVIRGGGGLICVLFDGTLIPGGTYLKGWLIPGNTVFICWKLVL